MSKSIIKDKSYAFAVDAIKFCYQLQRQQEFIISRQLIRSRTGIGALVREAEFAESRRDFSLKLSIALKESNETDYWLSLLIDAYGPVDMPSALKLKSENRELIAILVSIVKKTKSS